MVQGPQVVDVVDMVQGPQVVDVVDMVDVVDVVDVVEVVVDLVDVPHQREAGVGQQSSEVPDVHQVIVDGEIMSEHSSSQELLRSSPDHGQDRQQQTGFEGTHVGS